MALVSRSNFGTYEMPSAAKMRAALKKLHQCAPDLIAEGDMHGEVALSEELRRAAFGESRLTGQANLLIVPNADAGHIAYSLRRVLGGGVTVGPILVGTAKPAHIVAHREQIAIAAEVGLDPAAAACWLDEGRARDRVRGWQVEAHRLGVGGVPFFIVNNRYALSGAQPPERFIELFQRLDATS